MNGQQLHADSVSIADDESRMFQCPECNGTRFDLIIGGRSSSRIECASATCGYTVASGGPPASGAEVSTATGG